MARRSQLSPSARLTLEAVILVFSSGMFFLAVCLNSAATARSTAMLLILLALSAAFLFWERLRARITPPILALALVVLMDGVSCFYALAGKFALFELLKVISAFCLTLLLLALLGKTQPERKACIILVGFAAIAGLVSIDLISTRFISTPVLTVLGWFTTDYMDLTVVEEGVRITSVLIYVNTFASCMGIGVLLSLGLAETSGRRGIRAAYLVCLFVCALAFVLAFSMGACAVIVPVFFLLLAFTGREQRIGMLILMAETLIVTMLAAFPISLTSMTAWEGPRPIPLLCTVAGAAALCALDLLVGRRIAAKLAGHGKAVLCFTAALLAAVAVFLILACTLTTGITLQPGETVGRSAYPEPGSYILAAEADGEVSVLVESQSRENTIMHTYEQLYQGPLSQAAFTVPEDSVVVWFRFSAEGAARIGQVEYQGEGGSGSVPLGYRLLPGFIANRLQGLRANQNAIQRFAFFEDGMKMFRRSPVFGLGLGGFANAVGRVQSFYYFTKYAHSHYIQTLAETGIIGFALFLGLLGVSAVCLWRGRKRPLAPVLGAVLAFMAGHALIEGLFSYYASMPMLFCVFAAIGLCCGDTLPRPAWAEKPAAKNGLTLGLCAMLVVFGGLLMCNTAARSIAGDGTDLAKLEQAAALDPFEKADYMLTYVLQTTGVEVDEEIRGKADGYAVRLGKLESNIVPYYLTEYYLADGRIEQGFAMAEQYVNYVASDSAAWERTFEQLEQYEQDTAEYRAGVAHIAGLLDQWNRENMGHIELSAEARAFVDRMAA